MEWKFAAGESVEFNTVQSDLLCLSGKCGTIDRRLTEDEADLFETGPMYRLAFDGVVMDENGRRPRTCIDAFEDELTLTDESKFIRKLNTYRALGYRMVAFDCPNSASWVCCFNTKGVNADHLPIEAFANEDWLRDLHNYASWSGPLDEVEHMDVTDDPDEVIIGYDFTAEFPVQELVSDWQ